MFLRAFVCFCLLLFASVLFISVGMCGEACSLAFFAVYLSGIFLGHDYLEILLAEAVERIGVTIGCAHQCLRRKQNAFVGIRHDSLNTGAFLPANS